MKTKENGVTLVALVATIVILLILAAVGGTVANDSIKTAEFTQFKNELKILQDKVNELNDNNNLEVGQALNEEQKNILNIDVISNIIYKDATDEEKIKIQNGFRFCSSAYIKENFGFDSVERDYLINIEYRYVIAKDGFEYEGTTYYIVDQLEDEFYNVRYNDKNEKTGSFEVITTQEDNKWRIEITNINYNGYINNWQVKYKLQDASYWETSDSLIFYLRDEGTYNINVVYEDKVNLGTKSIRIISDGLISEKIEKKVIKIGDYVEYKPDTVTTETYNELIAELGTYSGNTDTAYNTTPTTKQDTLNWRVLDIVKDENGNDCVRLISEMPTTSTVQLYGAKGYNNAVYLLDKTCNTFYNKSGYAKNIQSLKIEDIEKYLTYDYTSFENSNVDTGKYGGTKTYTSASYRNYPNIFSKETTGWVDGVQGTELGLSEQTTPINETSTQAGTNGIKVTQTYWSKSMIESDFINAKYYNLFITDNNGSNYPAYWLSSRCAIASSGNANFDVRYVDSGRARAYRLYSSHDVSDGFAYALRPVITLNSDILVDATDITRDGTDAEKAWILK